MKDTKKHKKRAHNNYDDQASYQKNPFSSAKEAAKSGPRGTTDAVFSQISWWAKKTRERGKGKESEVFLQLSTILRDK